MQRVLAGAAARGPCHWSRVRGPWPCSAQPGLQLPGTRGMCAFGLSAVEAATLELQGSPGPKGKLQAQKSWGGPKKAAGWGGLAAQPLRFVPEENVSFAQQLRAPRGGRG